ncbi:MAG TPA: zinc-binding alcohol dehydrogenase [Candidatus Dormibacteraeota bacterium]|nr:zinc-binding alcohol dehydrogenase [Candidatus Dormibacteraeota bacterium]
MSGYTGRALWFVGPRQVEIREERVPEPSEQEITVRARVSLVSAGTEMLIYRGEANPEADLGLPTARGSFGFPVKYAYQTVGEVIAAGGDSGYEVGEVVFCRHPHQDVFTIPSRGRLVARVPGDLPPERAVFLNLLEVALTSQLDVPTRLGDRVVVFGQGTVGSFCAQLARRTAGRLAVVDPLASRRRLALEWGADLALHPSEAEAGVRAMTEGTGVDVAIEATGAPSALQSAIRCTGQEGTIVVMSFFGTRVVPLILSPEFHFRRHRIVSSQASQVGSGLQPRWSHARRASVGVDLLRQSWLKTTVTHRMSFGDAAEAYRLLDTQSEEVQGVLLTYP